MAAIDKMYLMSYADFNDLRVWAIRCYPKLFSYMTYPFMSETEWYERIKSIYDSRMKSYKDVYYRFVDGNTLEEATMKYMAKHQIDEGFDNYLSYIKDVTERFNHYKELEDAYPDGYYYVVEDIDIPVMNTPLSVDRYLLWRCPLPCVREYLEEHCGYKTRWYHKLFWRG